MTADKFTGTGVYALDRNLNSIGDLKVLHRFSQKGMFLFCVKVIQYIKGIYSAFCSIYLKNCITLIFPHVLLSSYNYVV